MFSSEFYEIFKDIFFTERLRWLLLYFKALKLTEALSISEAERLFPEPTEMFCEKVLLKISQSSQENTCARVFFFRSQVCNFIKKDSGLRSVTLLKKRPWYRCFPVNFVKLSGIPFFTEHLWWLLLYFWLFSSENCALSKEKLKTNKWLTILKRGWASNWNINAVLWFSTCLILVSTSSTSHNQLFSRQH